MKKTRITHILHPKKVIALSDTFLRDEYIGSTLILGAAILSIIIVNSPLNAAYSNFWQQTLTIGIGSWSVAMDLRHWVNEGLMAFFFLTVGLEIKREFVKGELGSAKTAILPIGAAVGGMIFPALIYLIFNAQTEASNGWGIPIATDIAFAVAVLMLLGKRVPLALKIFLLTLAIADDIGAITVIALFYAEIIHYGYLAASILLAAGLYLLRGKLANKLFILMVIAALLWLTTHASGIHASIVGAFIGLLAPIGAEPGRESVAERMEKMFLPFTTYVVVPLFAFANAGFVLSKSAFSGAPSVLWGIIGGLILGKVIGVTLASWLLIRFKIAQLPPAITMRHIVGVGFLAGIGFTVSIFITELAFTDNAALIQTAKMGIFIASFISAVLGSLVLLYGKSRSDLNR